MVIDYHELNKIIIKGHHPVPRIDDIPAQFLGSSEFSNLNMASASNQFRLPPEAAEAPDLSCPLGEGHQLRSDECPFCLLSCTGFSRSGQLLPETSCGLLKSRCTDEPSDQTRCAVCV